MFKLVYQLLVINSCIADCFESDLRLSSDFFL